MNNNTKLCWFYKTFRTYNQHTVISYNLGIKTKIFSLLTYNFLLYPRVWFCLRDS